MAVLLSYLTLSVPPNVSSLLFALIEDIKMAPFANNTNTSLDYIALTSALGSWLQPALYIVLGAAGVYVLRLVRKASGSPEPPSIDAQILKVLWDQLKEQKAQTAAIERIEERLDGLEGRLVGGFRAVYQDPSGEQADFT